MPRSRSTRSGPSAVPSEDCSTAASAGETASRASATSTVRLPSTRSSPAGLPVTAGSPKTPSWSSRSWNASPSGSPNAVSSSSSLRRRAGQGGADVQRPLDGVLRGLVAQHRHRGLDVGPAAGLHGHVQELPGDHLGAAQVEHVHRRADPVPAEARAAEQLVGPGQQQVAEQDRGRGAVLRRARRSSRPAGGRPRTPGASRGARAGCRRRPCSRRGPARWRAAARAPRRPAAARAPRPGTVRPPRGSPSSRTPRGTACPR